MLPGEFYLVKWVFSFLLKWIHGVCACVGDSAHCRTQLHVSEQVCTYLAYWGYSVTMRCSRRRCVAVRSWIVFLSDFLVVSALRLRAGLQLHALLFHNILATFLFCFTIINQPRRNHTHKHYILIINKTAGTVFFLSIVCNWSNVKHCCHKPQLAYAWKTRWLNTAPDCKTTTEKVCA